MQKDLTKKNSEKNLARRAVSFLTTGLIALTVLGGLLGWAGNASAEEVFGICTVKNNISGAIVTTTGIVEYECRNVKSGGNTGFTFVNWAPSLDPTMGSCLPADSVGPPSQTKKEDCSGTWTPNTGSSEMRGDKTPFENEISRNFGCGLFGGDTLLPGCLVQFLYYTLYVVPAFLLGVVAYFFNILIYITLGSTLLKSTFIADAWAVVRDLSNIFFILILLYISVKIILDLGGHEAKK